MSALEPGKWMTPAEVSEHLAVSEATLRAWRSSGKGPRYAMFTARACRYLADDVAQWTDEKFVSGTR
ncbi:helix-turn-helix transcriptional regulator [Dietzia cinnamea]|uniref:helix-turn-helix transcriptional regulator n=2 Tax=Dietzia cinnamea TaxID=321318 RepID=UPI000D60D68F|nr:helix-turn-helix domain-containing protein [Dietzia cinnamea]PWD94871.1 hypothetical protein DEQ16_13790 [Dietzia maris]